ncbi:MAG TPA: hypothetical protein VFX92_05385 [Candidatus Krumholzibacteria bacterium]|nr:hypothetical protein [Candidatus Krumholzibacteria bacterium]
MRCSKAFLWLLVGGLALLPACSDNNGDNEEEETTLPASVTTVIPDTYHFTISGECKAVMEITQLELVKGQEIEYCNKWAKKATLKFSTPGFLPDGATQVDMEPGQCVTFTVDSSLTTGMYEWQLFCEDYTGGQGGGPVKIQDPPPGP